MKNFSTEKLNGWPTAAIAVVVTAILAWYAHSYYAQLVNTNTALLTDLSTTREENYAFLKLLAERRATIESFQGKLSEITSVVETLNKLAQTDPELLKKYSKVYFLNENYIPAGLLEIDRPYLNKQATNTKFIARAYPYLEKLMKAANAEEVHILVASAYRSFETQTALKSAYTVTYGSGANTFSADQGYSEHQLGTTVDFTTTKLGAKFSSFASDPAYNWLLNNAWRYGFILSYPQGNAYYKFEPWHWRFVGIALAKTLHEEGQRFYDLDQREIDKYLINLFE